MFWISLVVFSVGILSTYVYFQIEVSHENAKLQSLGSIVGLTVETSLENYMTLRDFSLLDKTLHDLGNMKSIERVLLLNNDGIVKAATDKKAVGLKLNLGESRCKGCHREVSGGQYMKNEKIFRWIQPIRNRPACFGCHGPSPKINGIFIIDFSLSEWDKEVKSEALMGLSILTSSLLLIGLVMLYLSKTLIIARLATVTEKVRKFRSGQYDVKIPLDRNDEITRLERNFNEMAETINSREKDLKITLERVSRSQKMWQETFDSIGDLISVHDSEFNVVRVNRSFASYFGLAPRDAINRKCYEFFHSGSSPCTGCPHLVTLKENQPATTEMLDSKTGRIFLISTFPFRFHDSEFYGTIHVTKDITDDREKEMRLMMSERLAALGQMASGIAHEINNPLASIAGCTEGLLNRVSRDRYDPELFHNYLKIMEEEIMRCKSITTGMLSFVRKATYEKKTTNLNQVIEKALEIIGFQGRLKDVRVLNNSGKGLPPVLGNEGELRQVVLSIITNSLDSMNNTGTLTIETGFDEDMVFAKIGDTGPGIPSENIKKIFDPFFTTKSETGGTGLGLSIAGKIISNHNGKIHVDTELNKGTVFSISLPRHTPA